MSCDGIWHRWDDGNRGSISYARRDDATPCAISHMVGDGHGASVDAILAAIQGEIGSHGYGEESLVGFDVLICETRTSVSPFDDDRVSVIIRCGVSLLDDDGEKYVARSQEDWDGSKGMQRRQRRFLLEGELAGRARKGMPFDPSVPCSTEPDPFEWDSWFELGMATDAAGTGNETPQGKEPHAASDFEIAYTPATMDASSMGPSIKLIWRDGTRSWLDVRLDRDVLYEGPAKDSVCYSEAREMLQAHSVPVAAIRSGTVRFRPSGDGNDGDSGILSCALDLGDSLKIVVAGYRTFHKSRIISGTGSVCMCSVSATPSDIMDAATEGYRQAMCLASGAADMAASTSGAYGGFVQESMRSLDEVIDLATQMRGSLARTGDEPSSPADARPDARSARVVAPPRRGRNGDGSEGNFPEGAGEETGEGGRSRETAPANVMPKVSETPSGVLPYAGCDASESILLEALLEGNVVVLSDHGVSGDGDLLNAVGGETALYTQILDVVRSTLSAEGLSHADFSSGVAVVDASGDDGSYSVAFVFAERRTDSSDGSASSGYVTITIHAESVFDYFRMPGGGAVYKWLLDLESISHSEDEDDVMETVRHDLPYFGRKAGFFGFRRQSVVEVAGAISHRVSGLGSGDADASEDAAASPATRAILEISHRGSPEGLSPVDEGKVGEWYDTRMPVVVARALHRELAAHGIRWQDVTSVGLVYERPFVLDIVEELFLFSIGHGSDGLRDAVMAELVDGDVRRVRWLGSGIDMKRFAEIGIGEFSVRRMGMTDAETERYERCLGAALGDIF